MLDQLRDDFRGFLRWLTPGIGLKRWLALAALGLALLNVGAISLAFAGILPRVAGHHRVLGLLAIAVGSFAMAWGSWKVVRAITRVLTRRESFSLVDAFYENRPRSGVRFVAVGGGTGLSTLLRGLKAYSDHITAVVTMTDDGGSSGRLRTELGVLPPGDLRHCLSALAGEERLLGALFEHRFAGAAGTSTLSGHSFGNLFLVALAEITGDFHKAVKAISQVLAVRGQVLPATLENVQLAARLVDGTEVAGESQVTASTGAIARLWCVPAAPRALPEAVRAIAEADAIILGPGSLYTSLLPHLLIPEIREAIRASQARKLYVCNVMTQSGETDGFTVSQHLRQLFAYGGEGLVDDALVNGIPPQRLLEKYQANDQHPVPIDEEACRALGVQLIVEPLLDEQDLVRHDPQLLARAIMRWFWSVKGTTKILPFPPFGAHRGARP